MATETTKLELYKAKFDNPNSDVVDVLRDVNLNMDILDDNATFMSRIVNVTPPMATDFPGRQVYWASTGQNVTNDLDHPVISVWYEELGNAQYVFIKNLNAADLNVPSGSNKTVKFSAAGGDQFPSVPPYGITVSANKDRFTINEPGLYAVGTNLRWAAPGVVTSHEYFTGIRLNDSGGTELRLWGQGRPTGNIPNTVSLSGIFKVGEGGVPTGAYVEVTVFQGTGAARTLNNSFCNFWIARLGANGSNVT